MYGSLLVNWHRVVNKDYRLSPSAFVAVPVFTHTSHPVLAPSSRPVFGIHCPCVRPPIPHLLKLPYWKASVETMLCLFENGGAARIWRALHVTN